MLARALKSKKWQNCKLSKKKINAWHNITLNTVFFFLVASEIFINEKHGHTANRNICKDRQAQRQRCRETKER